MTYRGQADARSIESTLPLYMTKAWSWLGRSLRTVAKISNGLVPQLQYQVP